MSLPTTGQISIDQIMTAYNSVYTSTNIIKPYNLSKIRGAMITENKTVIPQEGEIYMGFFRGKEFRLPNEPPEVKKHIANTTAPENKKYDFNMIEYFEDDDINTVTFTVNNPNIKIADVYISEQMLYIDQKSILFEEYKENGTISNIIVTATDSSQESVSMNPFNWTRSVSPYYVNNISDISNATNANDIFVAHLTDHFEGGGILTFTVKSSDTTVAEVDLRGDNKDKLYINQQWKRNGTTTITMTALNGQGQSGSGSFDWTNNYVNSGPYLISEPNNVTKTGNQEYLAIDDVAIFFGDDNNDPLTYSVRNENTDVAFGYLDGDPKRKLYVDQEDNLYRINGTTYIYIRATDPYGEYDETYLRWTRDVPRIVTVINPSDSASAVTVDYFVGQTKLGRISVNLNSSQTISYSTTDNIYLAFFSPSTSYTISRDNISWTPGNDDVSVTVKTTIKEAPPPPDKSD